MLNNYRTCDNKQFVTVANGGKMKIIEIGTIDLFFIEISNVWNIQNCSSNLLSICKITREINCKIIFSIKMVIFQELLTNKIIGEFVLENDLYILNYEKINLNIRKQENLGTL